MSSGKEGARIARQMHMEAQRKLRDEIQESFAKFGDEVLDYVMTAALLPQGLSRLFSALGVRTLPHQGKPLNQLCRYINEHGTAQFLRQMESLKSRSQTLYRDIVEKKYSQMEPGDAEEWDSIGAGDQQLIRELDSTVATSVNDPAWFDERGRYIGPERRAKSDRRAGRERRNEIECIRSNRRYGGERRKQLRRKSDREQLYTSSAPKRNPHKQR